jgi:hypothetical protein
LLLGIPGDNTYSNYAEANRTFWRQTVIPSAARLAKSLSRWLFTGDEAAFELRCDLDNLDALAPDREALWARLDGAGFLTQNEKRAAAGYGPVGDANAKFNPYHDEAGRFTFAPNGEGDEPTDEPTPTLRIGEPDDPRPTPVAGKPRGPKGPPPAPTPKPPTTPLSPPPSKPAPRDPGKEPLKDILMPGGKEVGVRNPGASAEVRTVSKGEFDQLKADLTAGAKEIPAAPNYAGKWYQRPDGTVIGVRESASSGPSIDVVRSSDTILKPGYRLHAQ